jgi:uncharacterized protein YqgC (DUF456 family)
MPALSTSQFLISLAIATSASIAVFLDAEKRGSRHATAWGAGVLLVLGVFLPVYLIHVWRSKHRVGNSDG